MLGGWDGAVQDPIDKPADRGHRRLQLVGDVGDKAAAHRFLLGEGLGHVVEGHRQLAHLVVGGDLNPGGEVPLAEFLGGGRHLPQRPDHLDGRVVGDDYRQNQHRHRREEEHLDHLGEEGGELAAGLGDEDVADGGAAHLDRFAVGVVGFVEQALQPPGGEIAAVLIDRPQNLGGDGVDRLGEGAVLAPDLDDAGGVGEKDRAVV